MNQFFLLWADIAALGASVLAALFFALRAARAFSGRVRGLAAFFHFFGPIVIGVHLLFHTAEICWHAFEAIRAGSFVYNFRFYSLHLMGVLLIALSYQLFRLSWMSAAYASAAKGPWFRVAGYIALVSVPTIPFTPIGSLPLMACLVSALALPFVRKKSLQSRKAAVRPAYHSSLQP